MQRSMTPLTATLLLLCATVATCWRPLGLTPPPRSVARSRSALLQLPDQAEGAGIAIEADAQEIVTTPTVGEADGVVTPTAALKPGFNKQLLAAEDSEAVLRLVDASIGEFKAHEVATALHRVAALNKVGRARRDALLRDRRFESLLDAAVERAPQLSARCVADVLWSLATLGELPARMLMPVLTSVAAHLEKGDFQGSHLSTIVWSLAKLETKPVKLLQRIEEQVVSAPAAGKGAGDGAAAEPAPRLEGMSMQNCANLLWGFAKLNYQPATVLPHVADALLLPGMLESAKHVEVADLGFALGVVARPGECRELLQALAARAAPETTLRYLSSRQICKLIDTFARLDATAELPEGLLDAWIGIVRVAHAETPLMARDARLLEGSLKKLDVDATWVRKSAVLSAWKAAMTGAKAVKPGKFDDAELRAVFDSIDTDGSGDIDLNELKTAIERVSAKADDATLKQMIAFGDDDVSMTVSFDEFKRIMSGDKRVALV